MRKLFKIILFLIILAGLIYFIFGRNFPITAEPILGASFAKRQAEDLGLNWQDNYLALLDDLGVKNLRLAVYWDEIEPAEDRFIFDNLDWQMEQARQRNVKVILAIGRKLPRWPECFAPAWLDKYTLEEQQEKTLLMIEAAARHFRDYDNLRYWQLENEPFFPYGQCPKINKKFFDKTLALLRLLDTRPVLITDSGEGGFWWGAAKRADIVGNTLYRVVWNKYLGYVKYPLPTALYQIKANIVRYLWPEKQFIISELQAEPWGPALIQDLSYEEQIKSMNLEQFLENLTYARRVGFSEIYFWGSEWWYWLKTVKGDENIWQAVKEIFNT